MLYDIHNSLVHEVCGAPMVPTKRGQAITVPRELDACTWGDHRRNKKIPAGNYIIVNRKHVRGGWVTIEKVS